MPVVPSKSVKKIEFYENHIGPWTANAVAIGTSSSAVTALGALTTAARDAYNEQRTAQAAARAATIRMQMAVEAMGVAGSDIIKQVRAKAATAGDGVYSMASIPAPARPSPIGAPGKPTNFKVKLNANGTLELKWKCANPAGAVGTMYQVWRRIGTGGEFTYLGGSGEKRFEDETLPAGSAAVTYQVQGVRSTAAGPSAQFNVNFGVSGMATIASIKERTAAKKAA